MRAHRGEGLDWVASWQAGNGAACQYRISTVVDSPSDRPAQHWSAVENDTSERHVSAAGLST